MLLCVIINKSRLGYKEKIIDSVHKLAVNGELVAQQALDVHIPNTQAYAQSGNFILVCS
jgi:hypothetical protein